MKCPHCQVEINPGFQEYYIGEYKGRHHSLFVMKCPNEKCDLPIIILGCSEHLDRNKGNFCLYAPNGIEKKQLFPVGSGRMPAVPEVEPQFAEDYNEACLVLPFSPKASAALSRRCLQNIIRIKEHIKKKNLMLEIDELISLNKLPSFLSDNLQTIRGFGNIAAHGMEDQVSGQILDVEPEEADFLLDILELMFDFYFVQPAKAAKIRAGLNQKLSSAGKPTV